MRKVLALFGFVGVLAGCAKEMTSPTDGDGAGMGPNLATCEYTDSCGGGGGGGGTGNPPPPSDPAPVQPGLWINGVNPTRCFSPTGAGINDVDHDKMDDWCEGSLTQAFRPEMVYNLYDCDTRRDPYYAVKYFPTHAETVRITYMLAYFVDCGTQQGFGCPQAGPCTGHEGDSEFIEIDLRFEPISQHWYVVRYHLSAHFLTSGESTTDRAACYNGYPTFQQCSQIAPQWPSKLGAYFRVFVAQGKHGNYTSRDECNAGGRFGYDTCDANANTGFRLAVNGNHNVGSRAYNLPNQGSCVQTSAIGGDRPGTECFWATTGYFLGWSGINNSMVDVMPYGKLLTKDHDCFHMSRTYYQGVLVGEQCDP